MFSSHIKTRHYYGFLLYFYHEYFEFFNNIESHLFTGHYINVTVHGASSFNVMTFK